MASMNHEPLRLERHEEGRRSFQAMLRAWRSRSGLSFSDMEGLCELAMRHDLAPEVPDWQPRRYEKGELAVANGMVWRARAAADPSLIAPQRSDPRTHGAFEPVATVRRLFTSQIHSLEQGRTQNVGSSVFDTLGILNTWLADLRSGKAAAPADPKMAEKARLATVVEDSDGPYGSEELLAVYLGALQPPISVTRLTAEQASESSRTLARQIRQGMVEAGLDLVDDWARFVAVYPTSEKNRLAKVRDVAQGRSTWAAEQVEDEAAAVAIALAKLSQGSERRLAAEGNG